jgi:HEAT repeat protein
MFIWFVVKQMRSNDLTRRKNAFNAATKERNLKALLIVIDDEDQYVRSDAITALGEIGDPQAVPSLIKRLDDQNHNNIERAAAALAKIGDRRAVPPLIELLRETKHHAQTRRAAADALTALGDNQAVGPLIRALETDAEPYWAVTVLGSLGDTRAVPALIGALKAGDQNVCWAAVEALGVLGDQRATDPLLRLLVEGRGPSQEVLISALGRIGDARAIPTLLPKLDDVRAAVREEAAKALDAMGWRADTASQKTLYFLARHNWDSIADLGWGNVGPALVNSLKNGDDRVKENVVTALSQFTDRPAHEALMPALQYPRVADQAAESLAKLGGTWAIAPLVEYAKGYCPKGGGYFNDPYGAEAERDIAKKRVQYVKSIVKRWRGELSPEELKRLLALEDQTFEVRLEWNTPGYGQGTSEARIVLDFSVIRLMVEQELRERS